MAEQSMTDRPADRPPRGRPRTGVVTSDKMTKTVTVLADAPLRPPGLRQAGHPDQEGEGAQRGTGAKAGDTVRIMETRPLAKTVSWRVTEIVERAK